jgi:hypothetical protein
MPITILDYVKSQTGPKDSYSSKDYYSYGMDIMGGCEICGTTIAGYNAYPSTSGYWRCADCIADSGFATVEDFISHCTTTRQTEPDTAEDQDTVLVNCPACGGVKKVREIWEYAFACGECGATWRL